jgi:hypothetical protein
MADPLSIAATAIGLLKNGGEALNALRERSQRTKDLDIKDQIGALYDNHLQLKEVISRLLDDNKDLRRQLEEQQQHPPVELKLKQVGETQYYFKGDEQVPYCQPCYDDKRKTIAVSLQHQTAWGSVSRTCLVCNNTFYEKKVTAPQGQITPRVQKY